MVPIDESRLYRKAIINTCHLAQNLEVRLETRESSRFGKMRTFLQSNSFIVQSLYIPFGKNHIKKVFCTCPW